MSRKSRQNWFFAAAPWLVWTIIMIIDNKYQRHNINNQTDRICLPNWIYFTQPMLKNYHLSVLATPKWCQSIELNKCQTCYWSVHSHAAIFCLILCLELDDVGTTNKQLDDKCEGMPPLINGSWPSSKVLGIQYCWTCHRLLSFISLFLPVPRLQPVLINGKQWQKKWTTF